MTTIAKKDHLRKIKRAGGIVKFSNWLYRKQLLRFPFKKIRVHTKRYILQLRFWREVKIGISTLSGIDILLALRNSRRREIETCTSFKQRIKCRAYKDKNDTSSEQLNHNEKLREFSVDVEVNYV